MSEAEPAATGPRLGQSRAIGTRAEHLIAHQYQPGSNGGVHRSDYQSGELSADIVESIGVNPSGETQKSVMA